MTQPNIQELVDLLTTARDAYYNKDPILSDAEFDALEDQLRDLSPSHPYFKGVGAAASSKWVKVPHGAPMGSLYKVQTKDEFDAWRRGTGSPNAKMVVSEKLDGISISLRYENGHLVQALTRGDGLEGEDIFRNVKLMKGLPARAKDFTGFVRGEIVLRKSDHLKYLPEYKNPRNAASGISKRESDADPCKHLTVISYQVLTDQHLIQRKNHEFKLLQSMGFEVPFWKTVEGIPDVLEIYDDYVNSRRSSLDYDIDGLVVEFDDLLFMEELGEHDGRPKGARAFKFPHEQRPTILRDIVWQVGPSGRVTPVAIFDSVNLVGATVSQASLHNESNIRRLAGTKGLLGVGDRIMVSRRNDVIPFVESVLTFSTNSRFQIPHKCPTCAATLSKKGEYIVCQNEDCEAQVSGAVKRWIKKHDIKEWGETLIEALCQAGLVTSIGDIYRLSQNTLESFNMGGKRVGESTAKKLVDNLHAKKQMLLADFVGALGIELCGQTVCQILVDAGLDTLDKMGKASVSEIAAIPGMGDTKATAFVEGFRKQRGLIDGLLQVGIEIKKPSIGVLSTSSFCFTGIRDKGLEDQIKNAGGTIKTSVGRGLTYLVAKDPKSTSGKAAKAAEYGVKVIGVDDLRNMLS